MLSIISISWKALFPLSLCIVSLCQCRKDQADLFCAQWWSCCKISKILQHKDWKKTLTACHSILSLPLNNMWICLVCLREAAPDSAQFPHWQNINYSQQCFEDEESRCDRPWLLPALNKPPEQIWPCFHNHLSTSLVYKMSMWIHVLQIHSQNYPDEAWMDR